MQRTVGPFGSEVVLPVRVARGGGPGPSPKSARGPRWRRTSHGFYVPADIARTPEQRVAEASVVVPARGAITGWAALRWMGGRWFDGTGPGGRDELPVEIATTGADVRPQPGLRVCREPLGREDVVVHDGLRLTTAARSVVLAMRHAMSVDEAVVSTEMAAYSDLVSLAEAAHELDRRPGATGNPRARRSLALAHENSWSPMETRLRLLWQLSAGLPAPLVNAPVFDLDGHHLGTPDLLDAEVGLAVEYDGAQHHGGVRRLGDNLREDRLRDAGLSYVTVLGGELHDRDRLVDRLCRARRRAAQSGGRRRWTVEAPRWWCPLDTVERRRANGRRNGPWEAA